MSRVLVTGAGGFIGRALVRRLGAEGHEIIAPNRQQLDLLEAGVDAMADWIAGRQPTHCIHAAWYTNHADYLTHEVNRAWAKASVRLSKAFSRAGGQRFVGLGTCLEYELRSASGPCPGGGCWP